MNAKKRSNPGLDAKAFTFGYTVPGQGGVAAHSGVAVIWSDGSANIFDTAPVGSVIW